MRDTKKVQSLGACGALWFQVYAHLESVGRYRLSGDTGKEGTLFACGVADKLYGVTIKLAATINEFNAVVEVPNFIRTENRGNMPMPQAARDCHLHVCIKAGDVGRNNPQQIAEEVFAKYQAAVTAAGKNL